MTETPTLVLNEKGEWVPSRIRPLTALQRKQLLSDLSPLRVSQRSATGGGGGKKMSYVESWDVRAMLIRVFGFGGWSGEVVDAQVIDSTTNQRQKPVVSMMVTYRLTIHQLGAVYTETAVSGQAGTDFGAAAEFAVKTAESDAMKRCAINLGTAFGLSLYNDGQTTDVVKQVQAPDQNMRALRRQIVREAAELKQLEQLEQAPASESRLDEAPAEPDKVVGTDVDFPSDPDAQPADTRPTPQRAPRGRPAPTLEKQDNVEDQGRAAVLDESIEGSEPPTQQALSDVQNAFGGQA